MKRIGRALRAAALAAALAVVALPAAYGATTVVTGDIPQSLIPIPLGCDGSPGGFVLPAGGPTSPAPPSGRGSLLLQTGQGGTTAQSGIAWEFNDLAHVAQASLWLYDPDAITHAEIVLRTYPAGPTILHASLPGGATWSNVDLLTLTWTWTDPGSDPATEHTGTVADYLSDHLSSDGSIDVVRDPCAPGTTVTTDAARVDLTTFAEAGQPVITWDFEDGNDGWSSPALLISAPGTVTAGTAATVRVTALQQGPTSNHALAYAPVELWARPYGASGFARIRTATTDSLGHAAIAVHPLRATTYQWRWPTDYLALLAPTTYPASSGLTVKVRTAISLAIADRTLHPGQRLVATGRTTPAKPGVTVTLRRRTATGTVRLASATVTATGSYRIVKVLRTAGTYRVLVTIPAATGNLAGSSVVRTAKVS